MIDTFTIRCNILHLAFSGKLTIQIEEEGTAQDILNFISEKKSIVSVEEGPYTIPDSWAWVRLKDLYKINPKVIADNDTAAAFIPMERISGGFDKAFTFEIQKWEKASKNHTKFEDGDVAFAKITPCFENRKSFIAHDLPNGIGGGTTELIILRQKEMLPQYTYYLVLDQRFITTGTASYKGVVGQQRVQSDVIKDYLVPVAPYSEQKRIVEKIEQVFSVLDTIDELQAQYTDNLSALKSKLIDAAIQGKLTEQLPEDGTAEEYLKGIEKEKIEIESSGVLKGRKKKKVLSLLNVNFPFDIPSSWKWIRLNSVAEIFGRIGFRGYTKNDIVEQGKGAISLSPSNITKSGKITYESCTYLSWNKYNESPEIMVENEDVILVKTGSSYGKCAIVKSLPEKATINPQLAILKYILCDRNYLHTVLISGMAHKQYEKFVIGAATPTFSQENLANFLLPLPPLAEQKRIVQKLEEILPLCEKLK